MRNLFSEYWKQTKPVRFVIWDQMLSRVKRTHANELEISRSRWSGKS